MKKLIFFNILIIFSFAQSSQHSKRKYEVCKANCSAGCGCGQGFNCEHECYNHYCRTTCFEKFNKACKACFENSKGNKANCFNSPACKKRKECLSECEFIYETSKNFRLVHQNFNRSLLQPLESLDPAFAEASVDRRTFSPERSRRVGTSARGDASSSSAVNALRSHNEAACPEPRRRVESIRAQTNTELRKKSNEGECYCFNQLTNEFLGKTNGNNNMCLECNNICKRAYKKFESSGGVKGICRKKI